MQEFSEKRDFPRMSVDCAARYRVEGGAEVSSAIAKDLSGGGLLLMVDEALAPGNKLLVEIQPGKSITPPLHLTVEVVRSDAAEAGAGATYATACSITRMYREDELPAQFP